MLQLAVCDDEAVCLRQTVDILRAALGDTPHQLKTFQNAPAVLHMLAEDGYRPDIAVLDICMGELDGIVRVLESNSLELEDSLVSYERGVSLLRALQGRLNEAQQKVEVLMGELEGEVDDATRDATLS